MPAPTRFDNMKFPKYVYQEYPKWVKCKDGVDRVVQNSKEEAEATGNDFMPPAPEPSKFAHLIKKPEVPAPAPQAAIAEQALTPKDVLADLKVQCESLAIDVKGTWGEKRMREAIAEKMAEKG